MKIPFLTIIVSFFIFSCGANEKKNGNNGVTQNDSIASTRIEKLKTAVEQKDYTTFFKLFPDTYHELVDFYGFNDDTGESPLYFEAKHHIPFLFNEPKEYLIPLIKKTIKISINGKWEADAVSYFQEELSDLIIKYPEEFLVILITKPEEEITSFWHFVFDGSGKYDLQNKEKFEVVYGKINTINRQQGELLKKEFEKMYR
ncbi:hypothetical protein [Sphingobacterium sp. LRF_L2]|uniref:hypothetical protein n=1 Tax=Sphingobacterium sp. LRF_L2 TaxID=3369421 RepID=UPI003F5E9A13